MKSSTKYLKVAINLILAVGLLICVIFFLPSVLRFFSPFIFGWVISVIANPLVKFLESRLKIIRKAGSAVVIILVIGIVVLLSYVIIANLIDQLYGFIMNLSVTWKSMEQDFMKVGERFSDYYDNLPSTIQLRLLEIQKQLTTFGTEIFSKMGEPTVMAAGNFARNIPLFILSVIVTIISAYFFVSDRERILSFVQSHTSNGTKERYQVVAGSLKRAVGGYFEAQFKIMGVVAVILFVGLSILDVDYAIVLAILIAILDFFPFFGTGTVMVPWAAIQFLGGKYQIAIGLLIIWGISQVIRQVIQPKIMGDSMGMPALPTLFLLYIGFRVGGAFGLIIAVPMGMIVYNLYKAGIFSNIIKSVKILIKDINQFRKIEDDLIETEEDEQEEEMK